MLKAYDASTLPDQPNWALGKLRALVGRLRGRPLTTLEETHG